MLFETEETVLKSQPVKNEYEWPENYFAETDPAKRRQILDARAGKEDPWLEQLEKLFQARYRQDKSGKYGDMFLRCLLDLKMTAENLDSMFAEKKNRKKAVQALHELCLDEASGLSQDIMYKEMCQLIAFYITICARDKNYTAVLWGLGKKSDGKIADKIKLDLDRIGEALPGYLKMEREFYVLRTAIRDMKEKYF